MHAESATTGPTPGREERLENALPHLGIHASTVILETDPYLIVEKYRPDQNLPPVFLPQAFLSLTFLPEGMRQCIQQQVRENLGERSGETVDNNIRIDFQDQIDIRIGSELRLQALNDFGQV